MLAGVSIPVLMEALLFTTVVEVELTTLVPMLIFGILGAFVGTPIVNNVSKSERGITLALSIGLFIAALIMLGGKLGVLPSGGDSIGLHGIKLAIACVANLFLGIGLCFGIGNYAPCMVVIYFLGMSPLVSFPIMMGSGALVATTTGIMNVKAGNINRIAAMGMTIGGVMGVALAVYIVKSLPLNILQWLIIGVILYSSISMYMRAKNYNKEVKGESSNQ